MMGAAGARHILRWAIFGLLLCSCEAVLPAARGDGTDRQREYAVKAAFLLNFARFVEWPASAFSAPDSPIVIGVVGKDPYGATLDRTVQGKTVGGRHVEVRRVRWDSDLSSLHMLVVPESERSGARVLPGALKGAPVLTVGESAGMAQKTVAVNFYMEGGQVRFEINPEAARRARLTLSSRLLGLARIVQDSR